MSHREHADSQPGINLGYRRCRNCGLDMPRHRIRDDGWCSYCAYVGSTTDEALQRAELQRTRAAALKTSERVLAKKLARKDPESEVAWWRQRIATLRESLGIKESGAA